MRLFTALPIPPEVRNHLAGVQEWFKRDTADLIGTRHVSWVPPESFHVTLKFIGEYSDHRLDLLSDALASLEPPSMALACDGVQCFPQRGPVRVVAAGLAGDVGRVALFYDAIEVACEPVGIKRDTRAYTPHITMARSRDGLARHARWELQHAQAEKFPGPTFRVDRFDLVRSTLLPSGAIHEVIRSYRFS